MVIVTSSASIIGFFSSVLWSSAPVIWFFNTILLTSVLRPMVVVWLFATVLGLVTTKVRSYVSVLQSSKVIIWNSIACFNVFRNNCFVFTHSTLIILRIFVLKISFPWIFININKVNQWQIFQQFCRTAPHNFAKFVITRISIVVVVKVVVKMLKRRWEVYGP